MKNGLSLIIFTNKDGICEFSINGNEFTIFTEKGGLSGEQINLSVSAEKASVPDNQNSQVLIDHDFTIISIRYIDIQKLKGFKRKELEKCKFLRWKGADYPPNSLTWEHNFFLAHLGGIKTPRGWIIGDA